MSHQLISLTKWPTMPAPMHSEDEGEAWIWGDFVAIFQKNPRTCDSVLADMMNHISKKKPKRNPQPSAMEYPYAMVVFYKKHRNPHGPSSQPILSVGIEQTNYGALKQILGNRSGDFGDLPVDGKGPLIVGIFRSEDRSNLGEFDEFLTKDSARAKFFTLIRTELRLEGDPVLIGNIRSIYGHPETGWPPIVAPQKKGGCLGVFLVFAILVPIICVFGTTFAISMIGENGIHRKIGEGIESLMRTTDR